MNRAVMTTGDGTVSATEITCNLEIAMTTLEDDVFAHEVQMTPERAGVIALVTWKSDRK